MQMTFDQAQRPGLLSAFALRKRSGYMMRSEKRPGYNGAGNGNRGRRPRRKKRASIPYILLTLLISVILWPVGMVMLWRRKVRMQAGSKLLISMLTLCLSVFLIVFALTVHVDNPKYTAFQDSANDFLDKAAANIAVAGDAAYVKSGETIEVMSDFAEGASGYVLNVMADGLDKGVELAGQARAKLDALVQRNDLTIAATTEAPTSAATKLPATDAPKTTAAPTATQSPTAAPATAVAETDAPEATEAAETEAPEATEESGSLLIRLPKNTPEPTSAQALSAGVLNADGSFTPNATLSAEATGSAEAEAVDDAPEATAEAEAPEAEVAATAEAPAATELATQSPEPAETPAPVVVKDPGEAVVYYYSSSKSYHMNPYCSGMTGAPASTLAEAIAAGKGRCGNCNPPATDILDEEFIAWLDENDLIHTTDECEDFEGGWRLIPLSEAIAADYALCDTCRADDYALQSGLIAPEPEVVTPTVALKDAGDATIYHSTNGSYYHKVPICKNMTGSDPYLLSEMVDGRYRRCRTCDAPDVTLIGAPCLWLDEEGLCHTTDECDGFTGTYTLILRDDALAEGLAACPDCGASEYLVPNTVLASAATAE